MDYVEPLAKDSLGTSTITVYPTDIEEKLRTFQAFKKFQHHEMFRNPVSLTTTNTAKIYDNFVKNYPMNPNRIANISMELKEVGNQH